VGVKAKQLLLIYALEPAMINERPATEFMLETLSHFPDYALTQQKLLQRHGQCCCEFLNSWADIPLALCKHFNNSH
jgi:hypothetical protein